MFRTTVLIAVLLAAVTVAVPATAQQSLSLNIGYFTLLGADSRVPGDTIAANLFATPPFALNYRLSDFDNATYGVEWLAPLGDFFEFGVGVNYYTSTVASSYRDLQDQATGAEVGQDLRLRTVPITATVRFFPISRHAGIQPYVGVGVSVIPWRYSEVGDFIDPNLAIFQWDYHDQGVAVGPVALVGLRLPIGRAFAVGGEIRYLRADTKLDPAVGFIGDRLDLGGVTYQTNFVIRF
jgi:outer membrane protein W